MELNSSIAAVITGGASGLGEATARALRAKGVKVALLDMNKTKGEALAAEIGAVFCEANVTNEESVLAAFEKARAANGQERILVNCAGTGNAIKTASRDKKTGETRRFPTDAFNFIIQINLVGTYRCIAISAQGMLSLEPLAGGERLALRLVHVEQRDLHALGAQCTGGGFAEARGATGDHGGNRRIQFHGGDLPVGWRTFRPPCRTAQSRR